MNNIQAGTASIWETATNINANTAIISANCTAT
jgi:hypothetical protein